MISCIDCKKEIKKGQTYYKLLPTAFIMCEKCYNEDGNQKIMTWALKKHLVQISIKRDRND